MGRFWLGRARHQPLRRGHRRGAEAEDRPVPGGDRREDRLPSRPSARTREREGDHHRSPRIHRAGGGDLRDGRRANFHAVTVRVRFAPSPTGHLHVGGARTAIFNWLFARHHRGKFIIRIEDTDVARSTRESEQMVLDDLRWLGLQWDEGPDVGGPDAPYRQSERVERYRKVIDELIARNVAYRCYCTEEELEQKRKAAEAAGRPPHYDLKCWIHRRNDDAPHAIRFHVPDDGDVTIDDMIRGQVSWKKESLGDFILMRTDGLPIYNFSVVVDDHNMEITDVIRAEEHLTNTHRQVLIYRALQWDVPRFAHVSLILAQDRPPLTGYDQDRWAERLHYELDDPSEALERFAVIRRANLRLLERASPADLKRVGVHVERGEESLEHICRLSAGHDRLHLRQIDRVRRAVA